MCLDGCAEEWIFRPSGRSSVTGESLGDHMLERMLDLKNTFEGKFIAVFMSVVLVMSMTSIFAFAGNEGEQAPADETATEQPAMASEQAVDASDEQAVSEAVQHGTDAAASDASDTNAPAATPSEPLVTTAVDEAVVTFEMENAYVSVKDQVLSGKTLTTELHKELQFSASADTGFELESITAKNAANADVPVTTQDGISTIAAEYVDSTLVVTATAKAVATDEPAVETKPITSDTKIEATEDVETPEGDKPATDVADESAVEAPAADDEVVEVEADVSSPAFEGYATVGGTTVKVTAAEGILPEGTTVQAVQIDRQDVVDAVAEKVESQGKVLENAVAIDVTLLDADGNEIQPEGAVNVCFFDSNVEGDEVGVYRVSDDASTVETIGTRQADTAIQSFDVDHFTIYVVGGMEVSSKSISGPSTVTVGKSIELQSDLGKGANNGHKWSVFPGDRTSDASISDQGKGKAVLKGISEGHITVYHNYGNNSDNIEIEIVSDGQGVKAIVVSGDSSVAVGQTTQLTAAVSPDNVSAPQLTWSSSNPAAATVDGNGLVTGVSGGSAVITAKVGNVVSNQFVVTVVAYTVSFYSNYPTDAKKFTYDGKTGKGEIVDAVNTYAVYQMAPSEKTFDAIDGYNSTNYTFTKWTTNADGSGESFESGDAIEVGSNVSLFAQWKKTENASPVRVKINYTSVGHNSNTQLDAVSGVDNGDGTITFQLHKQEKVQIWNNGSKLSGWTVDNDTYPLGSVVTINKSAFSKSGNTYTISATASYGQETTAEFFLLKPSVTDIGGDINNSGNYYYVGQGGIKTTDGNITIDYKLDGSKNVNDYITSAPSANAIADIANISIGEAQGVRWYKIINTSTAWHVDGMLYTVGKYWNVNYYDNGELVKTEIVQDGSGFNILDNAPDTSQGGFDSWTYLSGTSVGKDAVNVTNDINVYAKYKDRYNINGIIDNGGTVTNSGQTVYSGSSSKAMAFTPAEGYAIKSIAIDNRELSESEIAKAVGSDGTYVYPVISKVTSNHSVVVKTAKMVTLTYDLNGGTGVAPSAVKMEKGTTFTTFASGDGLSNKKATFKGWSTDPGSLEPIGSLVMDGDKTVYAIWVDVYDVYYDVQTYENNDPSKIGWVEVHPAGAPTTFEVKAGTDPAATPTRLDWMPETVQFKELGIDGAPQEVTKHFIYWDLTNKNTSGSRDNMYIRVAYAGSPQSNNLSDGTVGVNNVDPANGSAYRQGMVTVKTHYIDANGTVDHALLTGDITAGMWEPEQKVATEQLYFAWQYDNKVNLAVANTSDEWVLNTVVRSDGGLAQGADGAVSLGNVAGNSTVDIYLTPKYAVNYFDVTSGTAEPVGGAQVGTISSGQAGTNVMPSGVDLIENLAVRELPSALGSTYTGWNTAESMDGEQVNAGSALELSLFEGTTRSLDLYAKSTQNVYEVSYEWSGSVPNGVELPAGKDDLLYNESFVVDTTYAKNYQVSVKDTYGNVTDVYTFSGWDASGTLTITDDVTIKGTWTHQSVPVPSNRVEYDWTWDGKTPSSADEPSAPVDPNMYAPNQPYKVDEQFTPESTIDHHDAYGNVDGRWTFSGWDDPNHGVMDNDGVKITGTWTWESIAVAKHDVEYDWTGSIPDEASLPSAIVGLVKGQPYKIDTRYTSETRIETHDTYGNVIGVYTFSGWTDPGNGTMDEESIKVSGTWSFEEVVPAPHEVKYEWNGDVPSDEYEQTLPVDETTYVKGQPYDVDATFTNGMTVEHKDAYGNVDGRWTFSGWTDPGYGVMGESDVTVTGMWTYEDQEVATHSITYQWENAPEGDYAPTLPLDKRTYVKGEGYEVSSSYPAGYTIEELDAYTNVKGVWTFSGWTDPNNGTMGDENIVIIGSWTYEPVAVAMHGVTYDWGTENIPDDVLKPVDPDRYVKNQKYEVDATYAAGMRIDSKDQYGNVNGYYTFSGWTDPNNGVMGEDDVVITGSWTHNAVEVQTHKVHYDWGTPGAEVLDTYSIPVDPNGYVLGQPYAIDQTTYDVVETHDDFGNVNGRWMFSGWTDPNKGMMGASDVTVGGTWSYEPVEVATHDVTYDWGDNAPEGASKPAGVSGLVNGEPYGLDASYTSSTVVEHKDIYGNVDGRWTFSGWNDPNGGVMANDNVVITGTWTYAAVEVSAFSVVYQWVNEPMGDYAQTLPTDGNEYVKGQPYDVDATFAAGVTVEHKDAFGNVDGRWTFSGWTDAHDGTMVEGGVVIGGSWTYENVPVADHGVTYAWENAPEGEYQQTLPVDPQRYVNNEPYDVDDVFVNGTTVEHKDAYGNVDGRWTFGGWNAPNDGVMGDEDVVVTGAWTYVEVAVGDHGVSYEWTNAPDGEYAQTLPTDGNAYVSGQPYDVDASFAAGTTVEHKDAYGNVDGRWLFGGWNDPNNGIMGNDDVKVNGSWTYAAVSVPTYGVVYEWTSAPDGEYAQTLPTDGNAYVSGQSYQVDATFAAGTTVEHKDAYGNVDGRWTFSGWSDEHDGTMVEGGVTVGGSWTYEDVAVDDHGVSYEWTNAPDGEYAQTLPTDGNAYVSGQPYDVDAAFAAGTTVEHEDAYGNVDGRWVFGGWNDPNEGVMGTSDVVVRGAWSYSSEDVNTHLVTYEWTGAPSGDGYAQPLPFDGNAYVNGQPYDVDATFANGTIVEHRDAYGNVDGRWTFGGWSDPNNGVMGDIDVTITGVWTYEDVAVGTHAVNYRWTGEPTDEYAQTLPIDGDTYVNGQGYDVDATFSNGTAVEHKDAYGNVDGRWVFGGWNDPNNGVMGNGDVVIEGSWSYESVTVDTHTVSYEWTGAPTGEYLQVIPFDGNAYVNGQPYGVDATFAAGTTVEHKDAYGNVDGRWTFSGWSDPSNGVMGENDVVVTGAWAYEAVTVDAHRVYYDWGTAAPEVLAVYTLPANGATYVNGQPYTVDATAYQPVNTHDAFGNINGVYTFSGWTDPGNGTMGNADITVQGAWSFQPVTVPTYGVSYDWGTDNIPGGAILPQSIDGLAFNQPYAVDGQYYAGYQVTDESGVYTFGGWTDPNNGVMGEQNTVISGRWTYEPAEYTVVYQWTNAPATAVIPSGGSFAYNAPFAVDTAFAPGTTVSDATGTWTFGGWDAEDFAVTGNVTITGAWEFAAAQYVVNFVDYEGTELGTGTYVYNDAVVAPATPTRPDEGTTQYAFAGWRDANGVLYTGTELPPVKGDMTYTAEYVASTTPPTPPTPVTPTPATPTPTPTPTPLPTPGTPPTDNPLTPIIAPVVDALATAAETVIGDNATPLAQNTEPRETEIGDNETPLAGVHAWCWVHWYIILGIIVTAVYAACVALRRGLFSRKLKKYEDDLTGGGDPAPGAPSTDGDVAAPVMPKGVPAGATLAAGLGE